MEDGGELWVECERAVAAEQPLFSFPLQLLVPIDTAVWEDRDDVLQHRTPPLGLTGPQRDLLDQQLDLYNATGKMRWARDHLAYLTLRHTSRLRQAVAAIRPDFFEDYLSPAEALLRTRVLRHKVAARRETGREGGGVVHSLMPLIDLLNHHAAGAPYMLKNEAAVTVQVVQPVAACPECYAAYGSRLDVLGLGLHYGYADPRAPFACSAPVRVDVPGLGPLCIEGRRHSSVEPLDPPRVRFGAEGLTISHLVCHRDHPERVRTALRLAVQGSAHKLGLNAAEARRVVEAAFAGVCDANLGLLAELLAAAEAPPDPPSGCSPSVAIVAEAAQLQAAIIREVLGDTAGLVPCRPGAGTRVC